jgi:hypothetical protein
MNTQHIRLLLILLLFSQTADACFANNNSAQELSEQHSDLNLDVCSGASQDSILPVSMFPDTLYLKKTGKIIGRILEIDLQFITYSKLEKDSVLYLVPRSEVASIHYGNGIVEVLKEVVKHMSASEAFNLGYSDGKVYYNGKKDFKRGLLDGMLSYVFYSGIVMIVIDLRKPANVNVHSEMPDPENYLTNEHYRSGYNDAANTVKRKKLVGGYLLGLSAVPVVILGAAMIAVASTY